MVARTQTICGRACLAIISASLFGAGLTGDAWAATGEEEVQQQLGVAAARSAGGLRDAAFFDRAIEIDEYGAVVVVAADAGARADALRPVVFAGDGFNHLLSYEEEHR